MELSKKHLKEKMEIAKIAVRFVEEGDYIILDSGSTTTELAKLLVGFKHLTVITNSVNIALLLGDNPGINVVVSGGEFKPQTASLMGDLAASTFKGVHVAKLFLATAGITSDMQLSYPSFGDLAVKTAMMRSADHIYLLADSSKIGATSFATLGRLSLVDTLITDAKITPEQKKLFDDLDVEVVCQ